MASTKRQRGDELTYERNKGVSGRKDSNGVGFLAKRRRELPRRGLGEEGPGTRRGRRARGD